MYRVVVPIGTEQELDIIIVDDASTDASKAIAMDLAREHGEKRLVFHPRNRGAGAANAELAGVEATTTAS